MLVKEKYRFSVYGWVLLIFFLLLVGKSFGEEMKRGHPLPQRVAFMEPGVAGIALALLPPESVAAVSSFCFQDELLASWLRARHITAAGVSADPVMETLMDRGASLVVGNFSPEVQRKVESSGIPVLNMPVLTLSDLMAEISLLGQYFNRELQAEELNAWIRGKLTLLYRRMAALPEKEKPRVLFLWGDPRSKNFLLAFGGEPDLRTEILSYAGARNAGAHVPERITWMTPARAVIWDPDVIVIWGYEEKLDPAHLYADENWHLVRAVREGQVYKLPAYADFGPEQVLTALYLARLLHPELTSDLSCHTWAKELQVLWYSAEKQVR